MTLQFLCKLFRSLPSCIHEVPGLAFHDIWHPIKAPCYTAAPRVSWQLWSVREHMGQRIQLIAVNRVTFPNQNVWLLSNYSFSFKYFSLKKIFSSLFSAKHKWKNINRLSSGSLPGCKRHLKSSRRQSWKWGSPQSWMEILAQKYRIKFLVLHLLWSCPVLLFVDIYKHLLPLLFRIWRRKKKYLSRNVYNERFFIKWF